MAILSKVSKLDHSKSQNSLKISFSNIKRLRQTSNFADCEPFLESPSLSIPVSLRQIWTNQFDSRN